MYNIELSLPTIADVGKCQGSSYFIDDGSYICLPSMVLLSRFILEISSSLVNFGAIAHEKSVILGEYLYDVCIGRG